MDKNFLTYWSIVNYEAEKLIDHTVDILITL